MTAQAIADRRVHPATVPLRFLKDGPSYLLGLPAAFAYMSEVSWSSVLAFAAVVALAALVIQWLMWRSFRYGVGEGELVIESGILSRNRRSIPFERVQDVDIERGPLQRLFGLAKVRVETGGAAKDEGLLDSVTLDEADRIRTAVRAGREGSAAAVDEVAPPVANAIFAMDLKRVLLAGLFNFSLVWIAGLFGFLQAFDNWLPFDIYDPARWVGLADASVQRFSGRAMLAALFLALVLGLVAGVITTLQRDYGFRLALEGDRFRRERGLFTRSEVVLAPARVQLAFIDGGPFRRIFGWQRLFFQTLSVDSKGGGHQLVAPLARADEVRAILEAHGGLRLPETKFEPVSRGHLLRVLLPSVLLPVATIVGAAMLWPLALAFLLTLPLLVALARIEVRSHGYAIEGGLLFVRRGLIWRRLWIVPLARVETIRISRGLIQRRLGLASLLPDTAGAPALSAPWILDLREERARALAAQLSGRKSGTER